MKKNPHEMSCQHFHVISPRENNHIYSNQDRANMANQWLNWAPLIILQEVQMYGPG